MAVATFVSVFLVIIITISYKPLCALLSNFILYIFHKSLINSLSLSGTVHRIVIMVSREQGLLKLPVFIFRHAYCIVLQVTMA